VLRRGSNQEEKKKTEEGSQGCGGASYGLLNYEETKRRELNCTGIFKGERKRDNRKKNDPGSRQGE